MRRHLLLAAVALLASRPAVADDKAVKAEQDKLKGTWEVVAAEEGGQPVDRIKGDKIAFDGDKITVKRSRDNKSEEASFVIDPTKKPKTIDIKTPGGETLEGVYELTKDDLKICFNRGGRPQELSAKAGTTNVLVTLKRQAAGK